MVRPFVRGDVLEVGAGIGTFTTRLAGCAAQVTALEPNRYCFNRLQSATAHLSNVTRHELTVEAFHLGPARGRTFDTIVCMNVLEHIENDAAVVREFRSLVSPGGRVVLLVPAMPLAFGEIDRRLGHYRRYTRNGISFRQMVSCSLLTPSCGLDSLSNDAAEQTFEMLTSLSELVIRRYAT